MAGPTAPIVAAVAQGGMSIGGQLIAGYQSKKNQNRTIAANKEQAEYAYAKDREMWEAQNAYNSPEAQMARLKEAGLNPNLVYGTGTVGNTSSGNMPRYNPPNIEYNQKPMVTLDNMPNVLGAYQDFQLRQAQIDNLRAQEENTRARTITESFRSTLVDVQGQKTELDRDVALNLWPYQAGIKQLEIDKGVIDVDMKLQSLRNMKQDELMKILDTQYKKVALDTQQIANEKLQAEKLFAEMRNDWMKMGVTTSDNALIRIVVRMMNEAGIKNFDDVRSLIKKLF